MKELRETIAAMCIPLAVVSFFFFIPILIGMLYWFNEPVVRMQLMQAFVLNVVVFASSIAGVVVLGDEVWDRHNMSEEEMRRKFHLKENQHGRN